MITVELIFVGLIAFAPVGDGAEWLAVLTQEMPGHPVHVPRIVQLDGTCAGDCRFCGSVEDWTSMMGSLDIKPSGGLMDPYTCLLPDSEPTHLRWVPLRSEVTWFEFGQADVVNQLSPWVISVAEMVSGGAGLRRSCRRKGEDCAMRARLRLVEGTLEPCHFVHKEGDPDTLIRYQVDGRYQRVANVISLTFELDETEELYLTAHDYDGELRAEVRLSAQDDKITLLVVNEPMKATGGANVPERLEHFRAFYKLLRPLQDLLGSLSTTVPVKAPDVISLPGANRCEELIVEIEGYHKDSGRPVFFPMAPHSPAECDVATIP